MDNEKEKLKIRFKEHADFTEIKLNPDSKVVDEIVDKLLARKEKFGDIYCPCRIVGKNPERNKEIVCPCIYHRGEIELQGHCLCGLFVR